MHLPFTQLNVSKHFCSSSYDDYVKVIIRCLLIMQVMLQPHKNRWLKNYSFMFQTILVDKKCGMQYVEHFGHRNWTQLAVRPQLGFYMMSSEHS